MAQQSFKPWAYKSHQVITYEPQNECGPVIYQITVPWQI